MGIFFSLVLKLSVVLAFVFVMPISTVHVYKIIILAVPTMIAKLKKASTLMSTLGEEISRLVVALPGNLLYKIKPDHKMLSNMQSYM